ncbi:MAG TPA: type II toxin-antitoxin system VapC family toxin, partial [Fodinibius sp.]|nr:type II toxin-antitoxin system VapC family toxin [Fodinibius sp.]
MNLVDSSGWIEYFADEENADFFAEPIQQTNQLIVSAINIYEVFKHVLREENRSKANQAIAYMRQARLIELDIALAIEAAETSHQLKIPMADSLILTTARAHQALLWTQDVDFKGIDGVRY